MPTAKDIRVQLFKYSDKAKADGKARVTKIVTGRANPKKKVTKH